MPSSTVHGPRPTDHDPEVHGECLWLIRPDANGYGAIEINGERYTLQVVRFCDAVIGYRVGPYEVLAGSRCNCNDFKYRRQRARFGCKHVSALRVLLLRLDRKTAKP